jgi:hypothetical protein
MKAKVFHSLRKSWEQMAKEAADFAATIPPDKLVSISHACDPSWYGSIIVWYHEKGTKK